MSEPDLLEEADPEEAFTALADETRVAILQALWNPTMHWGGPETLSFSDLRDAVGVRDSGQFNYHLDKLRGRFVRKRDGGYELTVAGRQIVGAIHAGAYTMSGSVEPIPLEESCPSCGGSMTFHYEDEHMAIECGDCDLQLTAGVPPGVFEGLDREEFPAVATQYLRATLDKVKRGFCWYCDGQIERDIVPVRDLVPPEREDVGVDEDVPMAKYTCGRCGASLTNDLGTSFLEEPAVATFFDDHGVDVQGPDWWRLNLFDRARVEFVDEAESRARITFEAGDDRLALVVDEEHEVLEVDRAPA